MLLLAPNLNVVSVEPLAGKLDCCVDVEPEPNENPLELLLLLPTVVFENESPPVVVVVVAVVEPNLKPDSVDEDEAAAVGAPNVEQNLIGVPVVAAAAIPKLIDLLMGACRAGLRPAAATRVENFVLAAST